MPVYLLGVDPGLTNQGYSLARWATGSLTFLRAWTHRVPGDGCSATKVIARETQQMEVQARQLVMGLADLLPAGATLFICSEALSSPPNAAASRKAGAGWGVALGAVIGAYPRVVVLTPQNPTVIKYALTGCKTAVKTSVHAALEARYPELVAMWPAGPRGGKDLVEHAADAAAAVVCAVQSVEFRSAAALLEA